MIEIKTFSWITFLFIALGLGLLWVLSNKTRIGRLLVQRETPWSMSQWTRILLVILVTCFILVNPLLHLLTFGIFALLYYIFVARNFLSRNIIDLSNSPEGLSFLNVKKDQIKLICIPNADNSPLEQKLALNKCLFSFPMIVGNEPEVYYEDQKYHVELNLTSKKYTSSLMSYITKSGFEVQKIKTNE